MADKEHWEKVYLTKESTELSWFQEHADLSLKLIQATGADKAAPIIDVGGGTSPLASDLLGAGFKDVTVLDISGAALKRAQEKLGPLADKIIWIEADITQADLPKHHYEVWHDRAVFHFLTFDRDRHRYVQTVKRAVKPGGHVIVASFGLDGPKYCSGLEVVRYSPQTMHEEFGGDFELLTSTEETHHTPSGRDQEFIYCYCRKG